MIDFQVYCDQDTDGGGWTVFQRRKDGSVNFARTLDDYKAGFGNLDGEFWLGNENLHRLLSLRYIHELRIDMVYNDNTKTYAKYGKFMVGSESQKYVLTVGNYSGTTRVDTFGLCNGCEFSIQKHYFWLPENAWWRSSTSQCNLNNNYFISGVVESMRWSRADDKHSLLKFVEMKFRETVQ